MAKKGQAQSLFCNGNLRLATLYFFFLFLVVLIHFFSLFLFKSFLFLEGISVVTNFSFENLVTCENE